MRSGHSPHHSPKIFAVQSTVFDLQRMLGHVSEQYLEYLSKKDSSLGGVVPATLHGQDDAEHQYPGYKIDFYDTELMNHFETFLKSHKIDVIKEVHADEHRFSLTFAKHTLEEAGLTNRHEGDYLFQLNKHLRHLQQQEPVITKGMKL